MADNQFIEVDAPHLCVMENESDELCNDGIYGKAMAEYLQAELKKSGYILSWVVCEDWGWYVPAEIDGFRLGICVYGIPREDDETVATIFDKHGGPPTELCIEPTGIPLALCVTVHTQPRRYWAWRRFRRIDRSGLVSNLNHDLLTIFQDDPAITVVRCCDEFPLG